MVLLNTLMKATISQKLNNNPMTQQPEILNEEYLIQRKNGLRYIKYAKGPFTGIQELFYENNNPFILRPFLMSRTNFRYGKLDGLGERFHENGQLEYIGNYKNGEPDGLFEYFFENGKLRFRKNYKNGKHDGVWKYYYENGQLESRSNFKNGKVHGLVKEFNEEGKLKFRNYYRNGKLFSLWGIYYDILAFLGVCTTYSDASMRRLLTHSFAILQFPLIFLN